MWGTYWSMTRCTCKTSTTLFDSSVNSLLRPCKWRGGGLVLQWREVQHRWEYRKHREECDNEMGREYICMRVEVKQGTTWTARGAVNFTRKSKSAARERKCKAAFRRPKQREAKRIETKKGSVSTRNTRNTRRYASPSPICNCKTQLETSNDKTGLLTLCSATQTERLPWQVVADGSYVNPRYAHAQRNKQETKKKRKRNKGK